MFNFYLDYGKHNINTQWKDWIDSIESSKNISFYWLSHAIERLYENILWKGINFHYDLNFYFWFYLFNLIVFSIPKNK